MKKLVGIIAFSLLINPSITFSSSISEKIKNLPIRVGNAFEGTKQELKEIWQCRPLSEKIHCSLQDQKKSARFFRNLAIGTAVTVASIITAAIGIKITADHIKANKQAAQEIALTTDPATSEINKLIKDGPRAQAAQNRWEGIFPVKEELGEHPTIIKAAPGIETVKADVLQAYWDDKVDENILGRVEEAIDQYEQEKNTISLQALKQLTAAVINQQITIDDYEKYMRQYENIPDLRALFPQD